MKVHWCCGDVYLADHVNIDLCGWEPDPWTLPGTTLDKYYTKPWNEKDRKPGKFYVDKEANILSTWPFPDRSVTQIVMISCWEHFSRIELLDHILPEIKRTLAVGGEFIVDFPDLKKDFELYYESNPDFFMELVYCNGKNKYSFHKWGWTPATFSKLWGDKFKVWEETMVKHDYPMTGMVVEKMR